MKIEHIAIWSTDIEKLKTFYVKYFGASSNDRYVNEKKQFQSYFLSFNGDTRLELMQCPKLETNLSHERPQVGYTHLAMSVGSETKVDDLTSKLKSDGYIHVDGPRRTGDGYYESVVLDPDGNRIEITV